MPRELHVSVVAVNTTSRKAMIEWLRTPFLRFHIGYTVTSKSTKPIHVYRKSLRASRHLFDDILFAGIRRTQPGTGRRLFHLTWQTNVKELRVLEGQEKKRFSPSNSRINSCHSILMTKSVQQRCFWIGVMGA